MSLYRMLQHTDGALWQLSGVVRWVGVCVAVLVWMVLPGWTREVVHGMRRPYWEYGHIGRRLLASERDGRKRRYIGYEAAV